jgi:hypothetical protein
MDKQRHLTHLIRGAWMAAALLAGILFIPGLRAQPAGAVEKERFLFIFETASEMKKRLPMTQKTLQNLVASGLNGQLQSGDSVGVWTFDRSLRTGQFPLQRWNPDDAAAIASGITAFIGKQSYAKDASFNALQPALSQVVKNSERLTVLIFCDGETEIGITPFDTGINGVFQKRKSGQKRARQPFIIVLRSQLGQYVGCTVNFPPTAVSFPEFPPLPPPPTPSAPPVLPVPPAPTNPPAPPIFAPPLIIVGTNVGTNFPPAEPPAPAVPTNPSAPPAVLPPLITVGTNVETNFPPSVSPVPTNPPAPSVVVPQVIPAGANAETNFPPSAPKPEPTNVANTNPANFPLASLTNSAAGTNGVASLNNSGIGRAGLFGMGAAFLVVAGALIVFMLRRARKSDSASLITRSMKKE